MVKMSLTLCDQFRRNQEYLESKNFCFNNTEEQHQVVYETANQSQIILVNLAVLYDSNIQARA